MIRDRRRLLWQLVLFAIGLTLGAPLVVQSWKTARAADTEKQAIEKFHGATMEIVRRVIRN